MRQKEDKEMRKTFFVLATTAFVLFGLSGCVTTTTEVKSDAAGVVVIREVKIGEKVEFHKLTDKPIHLGDGKGQIDDIAPAVRNPNPPTEYIWKFNLSQIPTSGELTVAVYSVAPYFAWGCPTLVILNKKILSDLSQDQSAGTGRTTTQKISLKPEHFRIGANKIIIEESLCSDGKSYNDSLIREVILEIN